MKTRILPFFCLLLLLTCACAQTVAPANYPGTPAQKSRIVEGYGRLPLAFEANHGQSAPQVKFVSRGAGYNLFLTSTEAVLTLHSAVSHQHLASAVLRMRLVGANAKTEALGQDELPGKSNYFIGNDPKRWRSDVHQYAKVRYANVYPGVDLIYYGNQRELEYDFVLQPGANPEQIRLGIAGANKLRVERGDMVLTSAVGDIRLRSPRIYQENNGVRHDVGGRYVMTGKNEVGFSVSDYDRARALVIDPVLAYSTYLGGSGDDAAMDIAVDASGNAYVTGYTASIDFPAANAVQPANKGAHDAFVTKVNADGSALLFSTYLGGSGEDGAFGIATGPAGTVYVFGVTTSGDFPTVNAIQPTNHGGWDAFLTKINADGNALLYSTYLGGSGDESDQGQTGKMAVDSAGNAYVTGRTASNDFPTFHAFQAANAGGDDAFVAKISADGSALIYASYLGGSSYDIGHSITADSEGNAYVTGYTWSSDFPTVNAIQPTKAGNGDTFVTKIKSDGSALVFSTYYGGSGDEWGQRVRVDAAGNVYAGGNTSSTDLPTVNAVQPTAGGGGDGFLLKIKADGSALIYATYVGGSGQDLGSDIAIDSKGNAYLMGATSSTDFPTVNAIQPTNHGGNDAFVSGVSADGSSFLFSTYLGGSNGEGWCSWTAPGRGGVAVDPAGSVYIAGCTESADFPITAQAFQQSFKGVSDVFVAKIVFGEATTTTLTSSLNPSNYGQVVKFTASVSGASGTPTGTVIFFDGSTQLGSSTLSNGKGSFSTSSLSAGSHSITAAYQGSDQFAPSTSAPLIQVVNGIKTTTTLVSSLNPSVFGQSVTFSAGVNAGSGTPSGTVTFYDGSTMIGSAPLASGSATISTSALLAGSHSITAAYQGSGAYEASTSAPLNQVVNSAATTTALVSSVNPAQVKQTVVYTATMTSQYGGAATGEVTFQDGGVTIATVTVSGNQAACSTSYRRAGVHAITAIYFGDANNTGSVSPVLEERIGNAQVSKTTLVTSGSPSLVGQAVTFTATVTSTHGTIPDGELVTFLDGKTTLGAATLVSGAAAFTTSSLSAKTHTIKASYAGDGNFKPSRGLVKQVVHKYATTTTLGSSPNPSGYGQTVIFTATVTATGPYPLTSKVKFMDGTTSLGTATVSGGIASLTTDTLAVGTHPITAHYMGDAANDKSTSPVLNQVVQ
jgi:hypothetical protein